MKTPQPVPMPLRAALLLVLAAALPAAAVVALGPEIPARVSGGGAAFAPQVAVFGDGGFVVAWSTSAGTPGSSNVIHARFFAESGAPASGEFSLLLPANQVLDGIAATSDGGFVMVWEQPGGRGVLSVLARKFDRLGRPLTAPFRVHHASPFNRYNARVAAAAGGGFAIAWSTDLTAPPGNSAFTNAVARFFHADGSPAGAEFGVAQGSPTDGSQIFPTAMGVAPDGSLAIVLACACDQPGLILRRFSPDGTLLQDLDPVPPDCAVCNVGLQLDPTLSMAPDGSFVVAWDTGGEQLGPNERSPSAILGRRYAADGTPRDASVFQANRRGGFEVLPFLASLADGGFIIIWSDEAGRDGDGFGVFGRAYSAAGATSGPDFQVDQFIGGDQTAAGVAAAGRRAVAVWVDINTPIPVPSTPYIEARVLRPH